MSYHQVFDRLGNLVARSSHQPIGHRVIQTVSVVAALILLALLYRGH